MKRILLILSILAGASLVAQAQEDGRSTGVIVGVGTGMNFGFDGYKYEERETSHNGAGYALDVYAGMFFNEIVGARLGWQGLSVSDRYTDFGNRSYNYVHGDLLLRPHKNIVPYLHAGYVKVVDPSFGMGAGIVFPIHIGERLSIVPDLRATAFGSNAFATGARNVAGVLSGTIGLSYRFGGRTRKAETRDASVITVPVVSVVHDTVTVQSVVRDTVFVDQPTVIRDTVTVKEFVPVETIVRDTVYVAPAEDAILPPEAISAMALFDTNKSDLREEALPDLNKIVVWFAVHPEASAVVEGHTDNQASAAYNQALSERRAKSVYDYLVNHGVSADRLTWVGYGDTRPVDTNDTPDGRQHNRRVEIKVE